MRNLMDVLVDRDQRELAERAAQAERQYQDLKATHDAAVARRDAATAEVRRLEAITADMLAEAATRRAQLAAELGAERLGTGPAVSARHYSEVSDAIARLELGARGIASGAGDAAKHALFLAENEMASLAQPLDRARTVASAIRDGDANIDALRRSEAVARHEAAAG